MTGIGKSMIQTKGPDGKIYYKFSCTYFHENSYFTFNIWALDWEDANKRMEQIKLFGKVDGQVTEEYEVAEHQIRLVNFILSVQNWFHNLFK